MPEFSKPRVICHMMSSLDGRTILSRWGQLPDTKEYEATAATIFEQGEKPGAPVAFKLLSAEQRPHGSLWLRYAVAD